jgi:predicted phosphate transport protein (TIGR00153 family)
MNNLFIELINSDEVEKRKTINQKIKDFEHANDDLTHDVFVQLGLNFITPFDREDIHELASALDDVADYIYASSKKIILFKIDKVDENIKKLADINAEAIRELNKAVEGLRYLDNIKKIKEACIIVNNLENKADDVFELGLVELFEKEQNAIDIIKKKDILQSMEIVSDKCEDAADVIESILVKYS